MGEESGMAGSAKQLVWRERVAAFEHSGLTRSAWCTREGVARSSLDYWRRRLRAAPPTGGLVPIVVTQSSCVPARSSGAQGAVAIEVAGVWLRAGADVDARWLVSLLRGLR